MNRGTSTYLATRLRQGLDLLDSRLSRLGDLGATAALTAIAVAAGLPLHVAVRMLERAPIRLDMLLNHSLEIVVIAAPIIFYARHIISELKHSREKLNDMSRRLAISVEEAVRANKAKSAFLANMSHELRTPLNAIMGFSEVMKDQHLGPLQNLRYLGYAGDIHASGRYLLGIINDILDLSKIEAGKMSLEQASEFPLRHALESSLNMVRPLAEKFGVALTGDLPDIDVRLVAVERMVRQIMINLVGNAIKFTPAGGSVHVCGMIAEDGGYAVLVRDTGVGMSSEDVVKALLPFGQVENRMAAKHNGTGLGLPLAKAMMELHGGTLTVSSILNLGTTIILNFPAARLAGDRAAAA